jgi:hypothetical protein
MKEKEEDEISPGRKDKQGINISEQKEDKKQEEGDEKKNREVENSG